MNNSLEDFLTNNTTAPETDIINANVTVKHLNASTELTTEAATTIQSAEASSTTTIETEVPARTISEAAESPRTEVAMTTTTVETSPTMQTQRAATPERTLPPVTKTQPPPELREVAAPIDDDRPVTSENG